MPRYSIIFVFLLAFVLSAPAFAADNSSGASAVVHGSGLVCFSIRPPDTPTKPETKHSPALYRSCDELCAAKGTTCTAATSNFNPPVSCDGTDYSPASTLCRCCTVAH
jgi:hypothetical protein